MLSLIPQPASYGTLTDPASNIFGHSVFFSRSRVEHSELLFIAAPYHGGNGRRPGHCSKPRRPIGRRASLPYSRACKTDLDATLQKFGIKYLIVTGVTTSICVESTVRDAMFRDYLCIMLSDSMSEPIGHDLPRTNHEASLLAAEVLLGWVSNSEKLINALSAKTAQAGR
jgi:nicotinamidase-related amidase